MTNPRGSQVVLKSRSRLGLASSIIFALCVSAGTIALYVNGKPANPGSLLAIVVGIQMCFVLPAFVIVGLMESICGSMDGSSYWMLIALISGLIASGMAMSANAAWRWARNRRDGRVGSV